MADIKMIKFHHLSIPQAKQLVQKAADDLAEEYDLESEWKGDTLRFHRSGVEGQMKVTSSEIQLEVTLGFLLKPFKSKFVEHIEHNFDRISAEVRAERASGKAPAAKAAKTVKAAKKTARKA